MTCRRRCSFRAPCGLFHTPAAVESCRKTAKKRENGLRISQTAYHAVCFSTRFSTGCGKVLPSCVGNGKENVGLRRGGLPSLSPVAPAFSLLFCPLSPRPLPQRGRGSPRLFHARGFAPCIPGAEPGRHRSRGRIARWRGGLPSLSPVAPTFRLLFCPYPPAPLPRWGRGRPRLFHARGFAPCIPGTEPTVRRKTDRISLP